MEVKILSNNIDLIKCFEEKSRIKVNLIKELDIINDDVYVISDRKISFNRLIGLIDNPKNYIIYVLSDHYEATEIMNIISVAKNKGIKIIPPNLTINQICEKVLRIIDPVVSNQKKIISFFGADSKVGTTMVSQCVAEMLSQNTNISICLMFLNECKGTNYINKRVVYNLDNIRAKLANELIAEKDILDISINYKNNLSILPGPLDILNMRYYHPEDIEKLISIVENIYDVVIIDSGCRLDCALSVASLNTTVHKVLVTTQQNNSFKNFERISQQIFDLMDINQKEFMLIINKYINSGFLFSKNELADMYSMVFLGRLPFLSDLGLKAEFKETSLLSFNNELFNNSIDSICKILAEKINIKYHTNEKNGFLYKIKNKFGKEVG